MVKRKKNKNIRERQRQNNIYRFSAISLLVIFSFFSLPTVNNFLVKNLNFKRDIISNAGINFDQELEKKKKIINQRRSLNKKLNLKIFLLTLTFLIQTMKEKFNKI